MLKLQTVKGLLIPLTLVRIQPPEPANEQSPVRSPYRFRTEGGQMSDFSQAALVERFWSKVKRGARDECWPWLAGSRALVTERSR
jgi:hypothetical protein